jgi:hypothetical protein
MSKPSAKKKLQQRRQQQQQSLRHQRRRAGDVHHSLPTIAPTFPGEQIGAATGAASWLGQKIATLLHPHKS